MLKVCLTGLTAVLATSVSAAAATLVDEDFEGEVGLPAGWTLVDNGPGAESFSITAGHDGAGNDAGDGGNVTVPNPGPTSSPGGWIQAPAEADAAFDFTLTYDVKINPEANVDDTIVVFGDLDGGDYYNLFVTEVDANNELYRLEDNSRIGLNDAPTVDDYAAGIANDVWYQVTVDWDVSALELSVDVTDVAAATSKGSFTHTLDGTQVSDGDVLNPTLTGAVQFGFGSFNDNGDFDNISVEGTAIPEPSTWALLLLGVFGLAAVARRGRSRG